MFDGIPPPAAASPRPSPSAVRDHLLRHFAALGVRVVAAGLAIAAAAVFLAGAIQVVL